MQSYRFYVLNAATQIAGVAIILEAETDAAAIEEADSMFRDRDIQFSGFELWGLGRRIRRHVKV
jgi:hypothetical protein